MRGKAAMGKFKKLDMVIAVVATLTGCASPTQPTTTDTGAFASRLIADKVAVAADAQRDYVALVSEDKTVLNRKQTSFETDEVDVDYIGKPQELLQTFAYRYGYKYVESGKRANLRTINIRVQKVAPDDVLRNIGQQVDNGADVVLDKGAKTLRLIYKNLPDNKG